MSFGSHLYAPYFEIFITFRRFRKYRQAKRRKENHPQSCHKEIIVIDHLDGFFFSLPLFTIVLFVVFECKETWSTLLNKCFHRAQKKTIERMAK